jgi:murein DD-endopeptidase MepM/ murein hydrolase activator NlpD
MIRIPRPHALCLAFALLALRAIAQPFSLPTENNTLLSAGKPSEAFLVGTAGKSWESGQFGCVRSDGRQFHEGLDIRCVRRDRRGEPVDPVLAAADGTVAYVSLKPGLSNYGNYIVLRHVIDNVEIHTLYAHLASVESAVRAGQTVKAGQRIATMGRTSNTRQRITTDRAHLHFEIAFRASQDFSTWHRLHQPGNRNDHGEFNGHNFLGIEPAAVLLASAQSGPRFSLAQHLAAQPSLLRIFVRNPALSWARRFPGLVQPNPATSKEGIAGWEIEMAFNGAPLRLTPRTPREVPGSDSFRILAVNESQRAANPCSRLVIRRGQAWTALPALQNLLSMATR